MATRAFLLLALAFAVVLLITSEVAAAKDLAENTDSQINDSGHSRYSGGGGHGGGGYKGGRGGRNNGGGHGGHDNDGGRGGHNNGGGSKGCRHGCCGRRGYKGCKCCSTFEEAVAYKQTQN
ncbi:unnamed protein product [Lactuca virosa]|uniref:Glycine-rich protein n=1 Tax=Lactuca virosa TaxID=75947 RepID=A0AAU9N3T3_9ASTR|nr:unnamed protein product [Lactuca virosa]